MQRVTRGLRHVQVRELLVLETWGHHNTDSAVQPCVQPPAARSTVTATVCS